MFKDKEKQREANRLASQRRRDKRKGMTQGGYDGKGMTAVSMTKGVTPSIDPVLLQRFREKYRKPSVNLPIGKGITPPANKPAIDPELLKRFQDKYGR